MSTIRLAFITVLSLATLLFTACATEHGQTSKDYRGLGAESVSLETLAKFAPPRLDPKVANDVRHLLEVQSPGLGMIAPLENALYFSWGVTGVSQIWRTDGPLKFPTQVTSGTDPTYLVDLTPDGTYLILSRDKAGEENPGLYIQSTKGGPLVEIQHKKGVRTKFEYVDTESHTIFYTANDIVNDSYALYAYAIGSKKKELLFSEPGLWSVADVMNDNKFLLARSTGSLTSEYFVFSLEDRKLIPVLGQDEKQEYEVSFANSTSEFFVSTPKFGEFRRLYKYRGGKFTAVTPDVKKDVESFSIAHNRMIMFVQYNDGGYSRLEAYEPATMKPIALPKVAGAEQMYIGSISRMGRYSSIGVETSVAPRTSYVFDLKTKKSTQWVVPSLPEIDSSKFVKSTLESYPAKDGTKIPMLVSRPLACATTTCPVVVSFHGGPEGQSRPGFNRTAQLFVSRGFIYVEPNVRGSDGYGKSWIAMDDGPKRLDVIGDIEDCATYIRANWAKHGIVPRIGVMGGSYGGYSTLMAMSKFAGSYDAGVSIVGMSSLRSFLMNTAPYRRILRISEYGDPEKDQAALAKLSPLTYLSQVKAPLLIIQGASDPRVPVGEALQMHEALISRGLKSPLIIFADEGHGSAKRDNKVIELGATLDFFEANLKIESSR